MKVTFYGVRGSTPCHGDDTRRYGGNTSCVAVDVPGASPIFFDLGTGARYMGLNHPCDGSFAGSCLLSHLHWDHVQGLPFFPPLMFDGSRLDVYAPRQDDGRTLVEAFDDMIRSPQFPVSLDRLPGTVAFHELADTDFDLGPARVRSRLVPHLGPTLGFRVEHQGRSVAYLSDHQQPHESDFSLTPGVRELVQGADLLIHDAQYVDADMPAKRGWGHSLIRHVLELAQKAEARTVALFHHEPERDDDALDRAVAEALLVTAAAEHSRHADELGQVVLVVPIVELGLHVGGRIEAHRYRPRGLRTGTSRR